MNKTFLIKKNKIEIGKISVSIYDDINGVGFGSFEIYPEFQNKHFGTNALKQIINRFSNYDLVYCFVDKCNSKAIHIYNKLGTLIDYGDKIMCIFIDKKGEYRSPRA